MKRWLNKQSKINSFLFDLARDVIGLCKRGRSIGPISCHCRLRRPIRTVHQLTVIKLGLLPLPLHSPLLLLLLLLPLLHANWSEKQEGNCITTEQNEHPNSITSFKLVEIQIMKRRPFIISCHHLLLEFNETTAIWLNISSKLIRSSHQLVNSELFTWNSSWP